MCTREISSTEARGKDTYDNHQHIHRIIVFQLASLVIFSISQCVSEAKEREVIAERVKGKGIKRIARDVGVGVATVQRIIRETENPAP